MRVGVDWKSLAPHRPLAPGDAAYVDRPDLGGQRIADFVLSGKSTVVVIGPIGIGKSTELARAAAGLKPHRAACLVELGLERTERMREISDELVLNRCAGALATQAIRAWGLDLSPGLRGALAGRGVLDPSLVGAPFSAQPMSPLALAAATANEVSRLAKKPVTLLIDGLEKTVDPYGRAVLEALGSLPPEVELVVVAPLSTAYGPAAREIVRTGERVATLRPAENPEWFLLDVLAKRLGFQGPTFEASHRTPAPSSASLKAVIAAAIYSSGLPRVFLEIVADAASYARLDRLDWPEAPHVGAALRDQVATLRRVVDPGDVEAVRSAAHSPVGPTPLAQVLTHPQVIRLLQSGTLLERGDEPNVGLELTLLGQVLVNRTPFHV